MQPASPQERGSRYLPGLPPGLDGLRIAQVSDVHFPGNQTAARAALEHLHHEHPDIVLLTGDMTESLGAMAEVRTFAAEARGSLATIALLGNWEYRVGAVGHLAVDTYRSAGVELLVNQSRTVDVGGVPLTLVGLDDPVSGFPDLSTARKSVVPGSAEIWLVHAPGILDTLPVGGPARCRPSWWPATLTADRSGSLFSRRSSQQERAGFSRAGITTPLRRSTCRVEWAPQGFPPAFAVPPSYPSLRCALPEPFEPSQVFLPRHEEIAPIRRLGGRRRCRWR